MQHADMEDVPLDRVPAARQSYLGLVSLIDCFQSSPISPTRTLRKRQSHTASRDIVPAYVPASLADRWQGDARRLKEASNSRSLWALTPLGVHFWKCSSSERRGIVTERIILREASLGLGAIVECPKLPVRGAVLGPRLFSLAASAHDSSLSGSLACARSACLLFSCFCWAGRRCRPR